MGKKKNCNDFFSLCCPRLERSDEATGLGPSTLQPAPLARRPDLPFSRWRVLWPFLTRRCALTGLIVGWPHRMQLQIIRLPARAIASASFRMPDNGQDFTFHLRGLVSANHVLDRSYLPLVVQGMFPNHHPLSVTNPIGTVFSISHAVVHETFFRLSHPSCRCNSLAMFHLLIRGRSSFTPTLHSTYVMIFILVILILIHVISEHQRSASIPGSILQHRHCHHLHL